MSHATKVLLTFLIFIFILPACEKEKDNKLPAVQMVSPENGADFKLGDEITLSAEASDPDGNISEVRFYINSIGVGSVNTFPYNYIWNTSSAEEGVQEVKVTAIDDQGATTSDEIVVILNPAGSPPIADFSVDASTITEGDTVHFTDLSTGAESWTWTFGKCSIPVSWLFEKA